MAHLKWFCLLALCGALLTPSVVAEGDEHGEHNQNEGSGHAEEESHEDDHHDEPHWGYHGEYNPDNWYKLHPLCSADSKRQSPINIDHTVSVFEDTLTSVSLQEVIDRRYKDMHMVNNGHSVNVQVAHQASVVGGALPGDGYQIAGVHFHWGSEDRMGSEHLVHDKSFPLEMHMVTYDTERYPELNSDAVSGDNSLAVLGTLFQISDENNTFFDPIVKHLHEIRTAGSETTIPFITLNNLLPKHTDKYFRYLGSLTTPPCAESVVWTIFLHLQSISSHQMMEFRQLLEADDGEGYTHPIEDNWRPTQPIHNRIVNRSFLFRSELSQIYQKNHPEPQAAGGSTAVAGSVTAVISSIMAAMYFMY